MRYRLLIASIAASGLAACSTGTGSMIPQTSQAVASAARSTSDVNGGISIDGGFAMTSMTAATVLRATVSGSVTSGGVPVAGASVALTNSYGYAIAVGTTNSAGAYAFYGVKLGTYTLVVNGVAEGSVAVRSASVNLGTVSI